MARKRIKTLAQEWNVSVEDVLASCNRLDLSMVHSDSALLSSDEAARIKADLDAQANRSAILKREKVLETTAGRVVEKRLTAGVMRRRHAELEPAQAAEHAAQAAEPFHFQTEAPAEEAFVAPFVVETDESPASAAELPLALDEDFPPTALNGGAAEKDEPEAQLEVQAEASAPAAIDEPLAGAVDAEPKVGGASEIEAPKPTLPPHALEATANSPAKPAVGEGATADRSERPQLQSRVGQPIIGRAPQSQPGRTLNLTRTKGLAPSLDEAQQGPKVLGKIDLHKAAPPPRSAPTAPRSGGPSPRPGAPMRPGMPPRFPRPATPSPSVLQPLPPADSQKPGARTIKKKRVVKKDTLETLSEREMRGDRFPKKRRALPGKEQKKTEITTPKQSKRVVRISEGVTVGDLARNMGVKAGDVIKKLMDMGMMSTMNQMLDVDTATLIAGEFGYNVENVAFDVESAIDADAGEIVGEATPRPPVVTVMGHVDHGKTSLLDAIRHTNVTDREFGGITQHIGAYTVAAKGRTITFVDTPGHEAFTAMRARGAKITDIVILVVAADEGVMPQTVEALNHARAAGVPIVVAINKIDRPEANVDRVKQQLTQHGLVSEDYGGDTIVVPVSARTRDGLDKLLEMILLQADVLELKANAQRNARGVVIESQLDRGRGPVATVLIQEGTLHQGDPFVCGVAYGRVRAMLNHLGEKQEEAGPAIPVEIFGLSEVPEPGTSFLAVKEESKARQVAEFRASKQREGELTKSSRVSLEDLSQRLKAGEVKELKVVIKGDVQGSVEALSDALRRLSTDEVKLDVMHSSAGAVSETDVTLAAASRGIVIGFNVRADPKASALAEKEGVEIRLYTIIYDAINDMREAMEGLLAPTYRERTLGRAEVRQTFSIPGATIAGSMVVDGKITRSARARLVRDGRVAWEGKIGSLRRFKDDAREVASGYECGIALENFNDVKPDDVIETFEMETVLRKLPTPAAQSARVGQAAV